MTDAFASFLQFDVNRDPDDVSLRWTEWVSRFKNLMLAIDVTYPTRQHALLLHYAGYETNYIFDTLPDTEAGDGEHLLDKAVTALNAYFSPKDNREYDVYRFRQATFLFP